MTVIFLLCLFFLLLFLNVPISFAIGLSTFLFMVTAIDFFPAAATVAQRMTNGVNSFALMAIPFFILSGQIMAQGGIANIGHSHSVDNRLAYSTQQYLDYLRNCQRRCVDISTFYGRLYSWYFGRIGTDDVLLYLCKAQRLQRY